MLQGHWGIEDVTSKLLKKSYEVLQVEVGLGDNIFERSYGDFEMLASHGWF